MGGAQLHGLVVVTQAFKAYPVIAAEAIAHRCVLQQNRQPVLRTVFATQPGTLQATQLATVEEHLDLGLLGEGQYGAVQRLGRDVEADQPATLG